MIIYFHYNFLKMQHFTISGTVKHLFFKFYRIEGLLNVRIYMPNKI